MSERGVISTTVIIIAILAIFILLFRGTGFGMMGPGMMGWQWWGGELWWMQLLMILFIALFALGIYFLIRSMMPVRRRVIPRDDQDRALAIARERLARGEITLEEFEKLKKILTE